MKSCFLGTKKTSIFLVVFNPNLGEVFLKKVTPVEQVSPFSFGPSCRFSPPEKGSEPSMEFNKTAVCPLRIRQVTTTFPKVSNFRKGWSNELGD